MAQRDVVKTILLETTKRVGYYGGYYLIVPDHAAGRRNRFTVYRIPTSGGIGYSGGVKVIGRELPLGYSRKLAKLDAAKQAKRQRR